MFVQWKTSIYIASTFRHTISNVIHLFLKDIAKDIFNISVFLCFQNLPILHLSVPSFWPNETVDTVDMDVSAWIRKCPIIDHRLKHEADHFWTKPCATNLYKILLTETWKMLLFGYFVLNKIHILVCFSIFPHITTISRHWYAAPLAILFCF